MIKPISFGRICHNCRKTGSIHKNESGYRLVSDTERTNEQTPDSAQQYWADEQVRIRGYERAMYLTTKNDRFIYNPVQNGSVIRSTAISISKNDDHIDWCYNFDPKLIEE